MRSSTARARVAELERERPRLSGMGERFRGYGVLGLPFTLGHVLAFRRFSFSSVGPPFASVWHRTPDGRWTFYVDAEPAHSCPRYYGAALAEVVRARVDLEWTGPDTLAISVPRHRLEWAIRLETAPGTRFVSAVASLAPLAVLAPDGQAESGRLMRRAGPLAGRLLHAGPLTLTGRVPNGQRYAWMPRRVWAVAASAAVVRGRDVGPLGPLPAPPAIGDAVLPNRGLFAILDSWYETYDAARHHPASPPAPGAPALRP